MPELQKEKMHRLLQTFCKVKREVLMKLTEEQRIDHRERNKRYRERHKNDPEYKAKRKAHHQKWLEKNREKWNAYMRERSKTKKNYTETKN